MPSVESAKRKLNFDEPRINRMEPERTRAPIWKKTKGRRLDYGETDPAVLLYPSNFFPNRVDPDSAAKPVSSAYRMIFTDDQTSKLEAVFRKNKFPNWSEKAVLSAKLGVPRIKVTTWFSNRRQKLRKEQRKGLVGPSGTRPVLPGSSLIQTSYHRSVQGTVGFSRSAEFPARLQAPSQRFPSAPYPVRAPLPSVSDLTTRPRPVLPTAPSPCQQVYPPLPYQQVYAQFPAPMYKLPQQYPDTYMYHHHTAASSYPTHPSVPAGYAVAAPPRIRQVPVADPKSLADEFPFSYPIAKELPHIFGNVAEDEVLDRPLTPSFELPVEFESICDSLSLESDQSVETSSLSSYSSWTSEDFADDQPSAFESCRFGSNRDFSRGFQVSKGMNFEFCRQD